MTALQALTSELARINGSEAVQDCEAQLAQVQSRIADALRSREKAPSQRTWREVNERLHRLYVMEGEIKADLARCMTVA